MAFGVTDGALNADELQYLQTAVLAPKIMNEGSVTPLDRRDCPTYNFLMSKAQRSAQPQLGKFRYQVKGNRDQRITWWDGADILGFENHQGFFSLEYTIGRGHMGDETLLDMVARLGVPVDYRSKGIRQGRDAKAMHVVVNYFKEQADDLRYAWVDSLRKHMLRSNADTPKCFAGMSDIIPASTNSTGEVGELPRSNKLLQHQLITGVTKDNIQQAIHRMMRLTARYGGGSQVDFISCGDDVYELLVELYCGSSTVAGKADYSRKQELAFRRGEKLGIGLPQNVFEQDGILVALDPVFEELDAEDNPAVKWSKQMRFINSKHLKPVPVLTDQMVPHDIPYNQKVQRTSYHGDIALVCDMPRSQGVLVIA